MKNTWVRMTFLGLALALVSPCGAQTILRLGTGEWVPLTGQGLTGGGPLTEVVVASFKAVGIEVKVEFLPFKRAELLLEKGELDGIFPYGRNEEREKLFLFASQLYYSKAQFFFVKDRFTVPRFTAYEDLKPFVIGGLRGSWYEPTFEKAGLRLDLTNSDLQSLQMLLSGRVDLVPMPELVAWDLLRRELPEALGRVGVMDFYPQGQAPQGTSRRGVNLMMRASDTRAAGWIARFNEGFAKIVASGEVKAIFERHFSPEALRNF